jgi:hypothetical protein
MTRQLRWENPVKVHDAKSHGAVACTHDAMPSGAVLCDHDANGRGAVLRDLRTPAASCSLPPPFVLPSPLAPCCVTTMLTGVAPCFET